MDQMLEVMPQKLNKMGYIGPEYNGIIHEQQLSGHSWLLRGLCEHYEIFGDAFSLEMINKIVNNLYLVAKGRFKNYPLDRTAINKGDVSGSCIGDIDGWILSSDTGCAFMSIDGLSHAYLVTKNEDIHELLDELIDTYLEIDKQAIKAQTHCTLTAARGMMRMFAVTHDQKYLEGARDIFECYLNSGMSVTYQNLNWWGRPDSWTEPCAIVDSLMLALELFKVTRNETYRTLAARVWHNGLATSQRSNGGAGTDHLVIDGVGDILSARLYEAYFCCTMRLAEGLWYVNENLEMLYAELCGRVEKRGRLYADGDVIYAEVSDDLIPYAEGFVNIDGRKLCPIVKYYKVPEEIIKSGKQRILF